MWQVCKNEVINTALTAIGNEYVIPEHFSEGNTGLGHSKMTNSDCTESWGIIITAEMVSHGHSTTNFHGIFSGILVGSSAETTDGLSAGNVKTIANDGSAQTQHSCFLRY